MNDTKKLFVALLLVSTLLGSFGQLLFKLGVDSSSIYVIAIYVVVGALLYGIATLIYLYILGRSHLSWAYGFVGFSYIFTMLLAFFVLRETVSIDAWIGVIVIAAGTALIGTT